MARPKDYIKGGDRILDNRDYSKWFFGLAGLLAFSTFWVLLDEFHTRRTYHEYQKDLRSYELAFTQAELDIARGELKQADLEQAQSDIETIRQKQLGIAEIGELEQELADKKALYDYWDRQFKNQKSVQDAVFYQWKHAVHEKNYAENPELRDHHGADPEEHLEPDPDAAAKWGEKADKKKAEYEAIQDELDEYTAKRDAAEQEVARVEGELGKHRAELEVAEKRRDEIQAKVTALTERLKIVKLRDTRAVQQIVIDELGVGGEYTFGTVDRCHTCHVNIDRPGFEETLKTSDGKKFLHPDGIATADDELRLLFRTHPRRDDILGSVHPIDEYGCTVCHQGDGRATRFRRRSFFAITGKDMEFVPEKDQPHGLDHLWDLTMFRGEEVQASCHKCHATQRWLSYGFTDSDSGREVADVAAPMYQEGKDLFIRKGCPGCHVVRGFENLAKVAPDLSRIRHKVRPEWLVEWVKDPHTFREDSRMPSFVYPPADGTLEMIEPDDARQEEAATQMAAYIWQQSVDAKSLPFGPYPGGGSVARGKQVVETVGCLACHTIESDGKRKGNLNASRLEDVGAKVTSPDWIYNWVLDPRWHSDTTRMPDLRLTRTEARDVTAYLWESNKNALASKPEVRKKLEDPAFAKAGERLMGKVGCPGCHVIPGQENASRIAPEVTTFAEKFTYELAYGDSKVPHTWEAWTRGKLKSPRQFIDERSSSRMPNFHLTDAEVDALIVFIKSLRRPLVPDARTVQMTGMAGAIQRGQELVNHYNCIGCHQIEGNGGFIYEAVVDHIDDEKIADSLSPPNLKGQGIKVRQEYMQSFLREPTTIRPWLKIRMPTFPLTDQEITDIISYFRSLEDIESPYDRTNLVGATSESIGRGSTLFYSTFKCQSCHFFRGARPPGELGARNGPDLALIPTRMRPEGVKLWLKDPQRVMPGTKMPGFFYYESEGKLVPLSENADQQMNDIVNFLFAGPHTKGTALR